jgi:hypothetical protein
MSKPAGSLPFLDRRVALARLLRDAKVGILLNDCIAPRMGRPCLPMRAGLAPRASCRRRSMAPTNVSRLQGPQSGQRRVQRERSAMRNR